MPEVTAAKIGGFSMKQRFSQVKSLKTVVSDSQNKFMIILMNWQNIVGKSNVKLMIPLELKQKTLEIAIPNNIVLAAASKFAELIMKKANLCFREESVLKLKFAIQPSFFKKKRSESAKEETPVIELSEEEITQKKQELNKKFGFKGKIAECAAKIELLNMKRGQNDK
jgi:hypothetical protein